MIEKCKYFLSPNKKWQCTICWWNIVHLHFMIPFSLKHTHMYTINLHTIWRVNALFNFQSRFVILCLTTRSDVCFKNPLQTSLTLQFLPEAVLKNQTRTRSAWQLMINRGAFYTLNSQVPMRQKTHTHQPYMNIWIVATFVHAGAGVIWNFVGLECYCSNLKCDCVEEGIRWH